MDIDRTGESGESGKTAPQMARAEKEMETDTGSALVEAGSPDADSRLPWGIREIARTRF